MLPAGKETWRQRAEELSPQSLREAESAKKTERGEIKRSRGRTEKERAEARLYAMHGRR